MLESRWEVGLRSCFFGMGRWFRGVLVQGFIGIGSFAGVWGYRSEFGKGRCAVLSVGTKSNLVLYQHSSIPICPDVRDAVLAP